MGICDLVIYDVINGKILIVHKKKGKKLKPRLALLSCLWCPQASHHDSQTEERTNNAILFVRQYLVATKN